MIDVQDLVKYFDGRPAVNNIGFKVEEGENLILLGTSGSGKTTTLRMINRLVVPDHGSIFINGKDVSKQLPEQLRRGIGYVLQNHGLFPHFTVAENIAIVPRLLKWKAPQIQKRASELFEKLNLDPALSFKYPADLSGGQQQRVGLARALMVDPPVLLMDEPFGALDNLTRINIRKEFSMLDELIRKTIIMVTHDVQEAFEMGDRICLMDQGIIMQNGTPEELLFKPENIFVENFLKEQRMQLELKSVLLSDVMAGQDVDTQTSVWDEMEVLLNNKPEDSRTGRLNIETLMQAFSKYKNQ